MKADVARRWRLPRSEVPVDKVEFARVTGFGGG